MCRSVRVRLTAEEQKQVARWNGLWIPIYASIAVLIVAALFAIQPPRMGEMLAATAGSAASTVEPGER